MKNLIELVKSMSLTGPAISEEKLTKRDYNVGKAYHLANTTDKLYASAKYSSDCDCDCDCQGTDCDCTPSGDCDCTSQDCS